jgi:hypothetical protein
MARGQRLPERPTDEGSGTRGNSLAAEFGGIDAVGVATGATYQDTTPPPKASAAPKGTTANVFTGLCEALNTWQQGLVKSGTYEKADVYEIQFVPASMTNAQLKKPGATDHSNTPMQLGSTAKLQKDPATNSMNVSGRTVSVQAGTQIIQFIDQVLRGSTYIADQQLYQIDEVSDEVKKNPSGNNRPTAWYKISVQVIDLGPDLKRNDHAYKMIYIVSPYGINETRSSYFPSTNFRGVQKNYDYWFTGANTAILNYEQNLNTLFFQVMSETLPAANFNETNPDVLYKRSWQTKSDQSDQYAKGSTNEPAANLADFLYNQADFGEIDLKIVGDPALIPQGELSGGLSPNNFSFSAFNNDDTINFDAQECMFSVTFNQPEDYNLDTGLMEVASNFKNKNGEFGRNYPKKSQAYRLYKVRSSFSKGRFEQDLYGVLYEGVLKEKNEDRVTAAPARTASSTAEQTRAVDKVIAQSIQTNKTGSSLATEFGGQDELLLATGSAVFSESTVAPDENKDKTPQPLKQQPPTSTGRLTPPAITIPTSPFAGRVSSFAQTPAPNNKPPQKGNREA